MAPHNLPDPAANAVPHDGAAQGLADADAEAALRPGRRGLIRGSPGIGSEKDGKLRARAALARAVNGFEVGAPQQARAVGKTLPRSGGGSKRA